MVPDYITAHLLDQCYSKCGTRTGASTQAMVCRYAKRSQKRNKQVMFFYRFTVLIQLVYDI